jgi:hypothetical protein
MPAGASTLSAKTVDRFVRRALLEQAVWAASGEEGLARVASPTERGRMVTLLWSGHGEAVRRGALLAANARTKRLLLADLLIDVLPKLAELRRLVGPDWSAEPIEPEIDPAELAQRLRAEAVTTFVREAAAIGAVWILQGAEGPACLMSRRQAGTQVLPCWHDRAHAEARIAGPWADMVAAKVPIAAFRDKTLARLCDSGRLTAPGYCEGARVIELEARDLAARLAGAAPASASVA